MAVKKNYTQQWLQALAKTHPGALAQPGTPDAFVPPPDPVLIAQQAANNRPYLDAIGAAPADLSRLGSDYGYGVNYTPGQVDDSGLATVGDATIGELDTSNPYSRAALLQKSYTNNRQANTTNLAARGQLYSGALQKTQEGQQTAFNQGSEANRRGFQDAIRAYIGGLGATRNNALQGNASALGDSTARAAANPAPSTVTYAGVSYNPAKPGEFAAPVGAPTAASVMASKSLKGTAWDRPIISKPYRTKRKP